MSHAEPIPATPPHPPRCPEPAIPAAARRRRLRRARGVLEAFPPANRYQSQLKGVALAMIAYMAEHWCDPGHAYDFERWWSYIDYYTRALGSPKLASKNHWTARQALDEILEKNQIKPKNL